MYANCMQLSNSLDETLHFPRFFGVHTFSNPARASKKPESFFRVFLCCFLYYSIKITIVDTHKP